MILPKFIKGVSFRYLTTQDIPAIELFYDRCKVFFQLVVDDRSNVEKATNLLVEIPPAFSIENKHVWGMEKDNHLIGIWDVLVGYPQPDVGCIGLFVLDPKYRGQKLGGVGISVH